MQIELLGARLADPANGIDAVQDIYLADGKVFAIGERPANFQAERSINADGLIAIPGLVELSARLRDPGQEYKANISSESSAAVAGGITTLCVPPDTDPVIDAPAVVELITRRARDFSVVHIQVIGALTHALQSERLAEMYALKMAGCIAVSNAGHTIGNTELMRRAMEYAATFDLTVMTSCEDPWLAKNRHAHGGSIGFTLGLDPIPSAAETIIVARDLLLAEQTGARVHFCRLSTAHSVELIARARDAGLPVTADVAAHQLFLTELDLADFDTYCHVRPPLRTEADRQALRQGIAHGVIDVVTSDHQPHELDAKMNPFIETEPGISGLDTLLVLVLKLADEANIPLLDALATVTSHPAAVARLDCGGLNVGSAADLCVFDPSAEFELSAESIKSRGKNTPFVGHHFTGKVRYTLVDGAVVFENEA
jgi:dihydroorotase